METEAEQKRRYPAEIIAIFKNRKDFLILRKQKIKKLVWVLLTMAACLIMLNLGLFCFLYFYSGNLIGSDGKLLDIGRLGRGDFKMASYVYAADNHNIIWRYFKVVNDPVKLGEAPELLVKGFIAAEDKRYFSRWHYGIDQIAMARAGIITYGNKIPILKEFIKLLRYKEKTGGSGIAQQYGRLAYAEQVPEFKIRSQTIARKLKEAHLAVQLVKKYGKEKVLEGFLNSPYLGHGAVGITEASRRYFGQNAVFDHSKSGLRRTAILISLNKSPVAYCPIYHRPQKPVVDQVMTQQEIEKIELEYEKQMAKEHARIAFARARWNWVLTRMREDQYINEHEYQNAIFKNDESLDLDIIHFAPLKDETYGHAARTVKEMLMANGVKDEYITQAGGMRITSSIDTRIQTIAGKKLADWLDMLNSELPADAEKLQGSVVIIENKTGDVAALVGGGNFLESQFNRVFARRSPGSGAKPFVYAAAIEKFGYGFYSKICNCQFRMRGAGGKSWTPQNFKERNPVNLGHIDLATGLIRSVNLATLDVARDIGMEAVIDMYHLLGVRGEDNTLKDPRGNVIFRRPLKATIEGGLDPRLPTAIGASDVNLLELANAYAVFARGGVYMRPAIIKEVRDHNGKILHQADEAEEIRVISEETARKITILLRAVTKIGTLQITTRGMEQQVAAKTGTSNGPNDLGVYGYTGYRGSDNVIKDTMLDRAPSYTIAIRIGHDHPRPIELPRYMLRVSRDPTMGISAGWVVGPLWRQIVEAIYENQPKSKFPDDIETGTQELLAHYGKK